MTAHPLGFFGHRPMPKFIEGVNEQGVQGCLWVSIQLRLFFSAEDCPAQMPIATEK